MAWGGKSSSKQRTMMSFKGRQHPRRLSLPDLAPGGIVPRSVMRQLQLQTLAGDQRPYDLRLQQLLTVHGLSKGG